MLSDIRSTRRRRIHRRNLMMRRYKPALGLGEILELGKGASPLEANKAYTFTYQFDTMLQPSESTVERLAKMAVGYNTTANRAFGSNRFTITTKLSRSEGINTTNQGLLNSFKQGGFDNVRLIQIETGDESTKPGGVTAAIKETAKDIATGAGEVATAGLKPLIPWIVGGVALTLGYFWLKAGGMETVVKRPKQPNGASGYTPPSR